MRNMEVTAGTKTGAIRQWDVDGEGESESIINGKILFNSQKRMTGSSKIPGGEIKGTVRKKAVFGGL